MEDHGGSKITGIRQIVRLKEILNKWQNIMLGPKAENNERSNRASLGGISPAISRKLRGTHGYCDLDEDSCHTPELPFDIPKGYLVVYIGLELRRFIIPTSYLSDPLFKVLLDGKGGRGVWI